jgi:hypothetical protein
MPRGYLDVSLCLAGAVLLAAPLVAGASAQEAAPPAEISPDGRDACFGRVYDAAHMQSHPDQKVGRIFFLYGHDPVSRPDETPPGAGGNSYAVFLATTMRGAKKPDWAGGWCARNEAEDGTASIHCYMDCERPLADVRRDAKGSLVLSGVPQDLYLDPDAEDTLGKAEYRRRALGKGDDNFRLDPQPVEACRAEFARIDPPDPALGPPLRVRLKPDQPFCYGRDYDAGHMKAHPDQATVSIRVSRGPAELASFAKIYTPDHWPDGATVRVAVTVRGRAAPAALTYTCVSDADQWDCSPPDKADAGCEVPPRQIFLRRGADGTMMLANPKSALPSADMCAPAAGTKTDDKVFRLSAMPLSACGL